MTELSYESTSKTVDLPSGIALHYHEAGSGFPVVCLHGGGPGASGWANFSRNIGALSGSRRVLVFDLPQFGKSSKPRFDDDLYPSFARIIDEALGVLGIEQADFIGNSMGGGVSCFVAHQNPSRARRLVLMGPGGMFDSVLTPVPMDALRDTFTYYNPGPPTREKMRECLLKFVYDPLLLTDDLIGRRYDASVQPDVLEAMRGYGVQGLGDVTPFLHTIEHETLIIFGLDDRVLPLDVPLYFARRMSNSELLMLPRVGHWVMWERADDFNRAVLEFLSR